MRLLGRGQMRVRWVLLSLVAGVATARLKAAKRGALASPPCCLFLGRAGTAPFVLLYLLLRRTTHYSAAPAFALSLHRTGHP